jgi:hypothetical protein
VNRDFQSTFSDVGFGIPIGAALGIFGFTGLRYMKEDADAAALDDEPSA